MKATLNEHGTLSITPEDALESYALKKWSKDFRCDCSHDADCNIESVIKINLIAREEED